MRPEGPAQDRSREASFFAAAGAPAPWEGERPVAPFGIGAQSSRRPERTRIGFGGSEALSPDRGAPSVQAASPDRSEPPARPTASERGGFSRPTTRPGARPDEARGEHARAAGHLAAAGEPDAAAARYLAAADQAAELGAYPQAIAYARQAQALLERLPLTPERRQLRVRLLASLGRFHWEAAGPGADFTLAGALALLEQAASLIGPEDGVWLGAGIQSLIAGVCYDMGDRASLDRALEALTTASRALQEAGDPLGAAQFLNDQAAVWVRLGDPVRAVHLLNESRKVYETRAKHDPNARLELAETLHLLARLTFHVPARPGRETDAIQVGIDNALAAEQAYRDLGIARELGRVWETLGKLEARGRRPQRALDYLRRAMEVQQVLGDVIGLARTTGTLSEVLTAQGQFQDALSLLAESIALNLEKGSPVGLAYNRRSLGAIVAAVPPAGRARVSRAVEAVTGRLVAAEGMLARIPLPDSEPG
jgi:tetratricopeptide (TPR) repeat protein